MDFNVATLPANISANEDWAAATSDMAVVLDGATVRTDTGCTHGPAWYARKLGGAIIGGAGDQSRELADILADAIAEVADMHRSTCDLTHPGTPSAALAIVRAEDDQVRYAVLGDVTIVAEVDGDVRTVSDQRISLTATAERKLADQHPIGSPEKSKAMIAMKHAELAARNVEGGYWIAAADPSAARHAITGSWPAASVRDFAVLTDGAARCVDTFESLTWPGLLGALRTTGPQFILDYVRQIERHDDRGLRFPRNKASDDATIVYATPARSEPAPRQLPPRELRLKPYHESPIFQSFASGRLMGDRAVSS